MKAISWKYLSLKQLLQNHFDGTLTRKRENSDTVVSSQRSEGVCIALLNVCIRFQMFSSGFPFDALLTVVAAS